MYHLLKYDDNGISVLYLWLAQKTTVSEASANNAIIPSCNPAYLNSTINELSFRGRYAQERSQVLSSTDFSIVFVTGAVLCQASLHGDF